MKRVAIIAVCVLLLAMGGIFIVNGQVGGQGGHDNLQSASVKVGIIMIGSRSDSNWNEAHWKGLQAAGEELHLTLECKENVTAANCEAVILQMIREHCQIIISTSIDFQNEVSRVAEKYPQVYFFQATGTHHHANVATYMGRMYQIRYLAGLVAGHQTRSHAIGYVTTQPIPEVIRGIDAFTLGVRKVDPAARVYVWFTNNWSDDGKAQKATYDLLQARPDIDVLAMHIDTDGPLQIANERGIYAIGCNVDRGAKYPNIFLTAPVWNWKIFYTQYIREALNGKFEGQNYLVGANSGIVALAPLTANPDKAILELIEKEQTRLMSGEYDVFYGPIHDNHGHLRVEAGEGIPDKILFEDLDWYVEGVVLP